MLNSLYANFTYKMFYLKHTKTLCMYFFIHTILKVLKVVYTHTFY